MERLVEVTLKKVHILSILDCYYRLFPLIHISYDSEGITIQGPASPQGRASRGPVIPVRNGGCLLPGLFPETLEGYECREPLSCSCTQSPERTGWQMCENRSLKSG